MSLEGKWQEEKLWFYPSFNICPLTGIFPAKKKTKLNSLIFFSKQRPEGFKAAVCLQSMIHSNTLLLCIDTSSFCLPRDTLRYSIKWFAIVFFFFRCDYHVLLEIYYMKIQRQVSFCVVLSGACRSLSYRWTSLNPSWWLKLTLF